MKNIRTSTSSYRSLVTRVVLLLGLVATGALQAQLPELGLPSTLSGGATSARFLGGASADEGASYAARFPYAQPIDVMTEIQVEAGHVGSTGNLYVIIVLAETLFMRDLNGDYQVWDGDLATLQAAFPGKQLQASEPITIVDDTPFGPAGVFNTALDIYLAYDSQLAPGELYFNGLPLNFRIDALSQTLYSDTISAPIVQNTCIVCHRAGGVAAASGLLYLDSSVPGYQDSNYNTLMDYIQNAPSGADLIVSKPQGLSSHGGGVQLAPGSDELADWLAFTSQALLEIAGSGGSQNIFELVLDMDAGQTLRKAALLFAGRLPTEAELASVAGGDDDVLRQTIRDLMEGEGFRTFLTESANDQLLTRAFSFNLTNIVDRFYYPNAMQYYMNPDKRAERLLVSAALADEPLQLIAHVVDNERPYTEILTADYIMLNPYSAKVYGGNVAFNDPEDFNEWREGEITEYYRCTICGRGQFAQYDIATDYPHAGILNSPAFLARYPSTETNRNRARARWAYYYFLGVDIEKLSERTTDPDALADEDNPTLNNPNCVVCHDIMDPVAGAFRFYGDDGFYKDQRGGEHALPRSYRIDPNGGYQPGDTWYADMLAPGFGQELAPSTGDTMQWLAQEFVVDSRFGFGTVNFWYPAVMGREPYAEPENPEDLDYLSRLAAYSTEQARMQQFAADFVSGSAGNGAHNLKDLLVDMVMSEYFRAVSVTQQTSQQAVELQEVGAGKLLTPEQLGRKLEDATGYSWNYGRVRALGDVYRLIYGGIDSDAITERARELTSLMSTVVVAMANETACPIVSQDFGLDQGERLLFPEVELSTLPATDPAAIRRNIQHLHDRLWSETVASDDPEVDATYNLFVAVYNARLAAGRGGAVSFSDEICILENVENPVNFDANQTLRSWAAVVNYMLRDYKFIYE